MHMGLWLTGKRVEGSWAHVDEKSSFYELKAYVTNVFRRVGLAPQMYTVENGDNNIYAKSLRIKARNGKLLAEMGVVSGRMLKATGISAEVFYAEIMWGNVIKAVRKNTVLYHEISRYPAVSRDLALLVDKSVEFAAIEAIAAQTEKKLLKSVELFDVYEGKNLPEGKKSYAVNFILQDESKTLNDKQIENVMNRLITNLKTKLGAELR